MAAAGSFSVYAKTLTGSTAEVRTSPDETIAALKEKIESALKLTVPILRLVYDSKELTDTQTVGEHGIAKESIIIVVIGSSKPCHFFFALDESGSMSGGRWQQLISSFQDFVKMRHEEAEKKGTKIVDRVSVFFHETGCRVASWRKPSGETVPFDSIPLADVTPESLVNDFGSGGNNFDHALNFLTPYLRKSAADYIPVLMFMTDGGDCGDDAPSDPNFRDRAYNRMAAIKKELPELRLYVTVVYTTGQQDIDCAKKLCLAGGSDIETFFTYIEQEAHPAAFAPVSYAPAVSSSAPFSRSLRSAAPSPVAASVSAAPPRASAQAKMTKQWEHAYQCNSSYVPR